jgi:glucosamine-6-phosphate deaminase
MSKPDSPVYRRIDDLRVEIYPSAEAMGLAAAAHVAEKLRDLMAIKQKVRVILASANSQLPFFKALRSRDDIDWSRVEAFHMDEYVGITSDHPASFRRFLKREITEPLKLAAFHGISGENTAIDNAMREYAALLDQAPIDICCMGIGENGHLAFNDPPEARFDDPEPIRLVKLDEASRRQQVGEGHFPNLAAVPTHAITLTIPTLLRARHVVVVVPEARKAAAVRRVLLGHVDPACPASILRTAPHAILYLDRDAARGLICGQAPWDELEATDRRWLV